MIPIRKKFFDLKNLLAAASVVMLGFGRASAWAYLAPFTAILGYACAFGALARFPLRKQRLIAGLALFTAIVLLQSCWLLSHPYSYIILVWIALSLLFAIPYTLLSLLVISRAFGETSSCEVRNASEEQRAEQKSSRYGRGEVVPLVGPPQKDLCPEFCKRLSNKKQSVLSSAGLAAAFALLEWGFTRLPCGYTFQCAALHLSWNLLPLQLASAVGGIGLSFFVFWSNILFFYWLFTPCFSTSGQRLNIKSRFAMPALIIAIAPYAAGGCMYWYKSAEQQSFDQKASPLRISFYHMEEPPDVYSKGFSPEQLLEKEWQKILSLAETVVPGTTDLIVLPEGVAPYSAEAPLFPVLHLPEKWKEAVPSPHRYLSSLDLSEMISSSLKSALLIGLEGRGMDDTGNVVAYNSCFFITPSSPTVARYDKQLLLPLGEYIPFRFLRSALAAYGVHDSFSPGEGSVLFTQGRMRIVPLICYEETFSTYGMAASHFRPNLLVTLSNDCWYPGIRREHFELARLRTVEMGIPMVRSCNQGVSAAVDALGRSIALRGEQPEKENSCVTAALSGYTAFSLYAVIGDGGIAVFLTLLCAVSFFHSCLAPKSDKIEHLALG
jgi:apolipoprotein N-acyltransferase